MDNYLYQNLNLSFIAILCIILFVLSINILYKYKKQYPLLVLSGDYLLWIIITVLMIFTTIIEIFNLSNLLNLYIKSITKISGFYGIRRIFQALLISTAGFIIFSVLVYLKHHFIRLLSKYGIAVIGILIICSLTILDFLSFHYLDRILNIKILQFTFSELIKMWGICMIYFSWYKYHISFFK